MKKALLDKFSTFNLLTYWKLSMLPLLCVVLGMLVIVAVTICRHLTSLPPGFGKFVMAAWPSYYRLLSRTSQAVTK